VALFLVLTIILGSFGTDCKYWTLEALDIAQTEHPKYIQSQLGHSSIHVTMNIYGALGEAVNQKAASILGKTVPGDQKTHDEAENKSSLNDANPLRYP
jgi:hypothetical protein